MREATHAEIEQVFVRLVLREPDWEGVEWTRKWFGPHSLDWWIESIVRSAEFKQLTGARE